ncbi:GNAT family N-acetyltransferase [Piscinibacter terrae]|nr:GNAT family N-acetyltransferase [Albitalea terrae]
MSIDYALHHRDIPPELIAEVASLSEHVFETSTIDHAWRLTHMPDVSLFCARQAGELIGFKAGYAIAERKYYSWLGAVHPQWRRQGVASRLADMQHQWLVERGFAVVETSSRHENSAMARINLHSGFVTVGTKLEPHGLQVLWAKTLA